MAALLCAEQLGKTYAMGKNAQLQVLKDVSLDIEPGQFVSIMGPSGSGKSTLLYSISGMDRPSSGSVRLAGREIGSLPENELAKLRLTEMGFVFQQPNLLRNLSIFDNIILAAYLGGGEKRDRINKRAVELMRRTGIEHLMGNDATQASGGELQRAAICRALINEPTILFADEPTGALNSSAAREVLDIFGAIHREGRTILMVTHDAEVASRSERVLFMMDGCIKGEHALGKYDPAQADGIKRRQALSEWLARMGF